MRIKLAVNTKKAGLILLLLLGLFFPAISARAQIWNARFPSGNSGEYFQSIASSADGSTLVVVSSDSDNTASSIGQINVSTNYGISWQTAEAPLNWWTCVACSSNGIKMVASAINPATPALAGIYTSANSGATWQQCAVSPKIGGANLGNGAPGSIASSADGTKLILASDGIYLSTDSGATWQRPTTPSFITNLMGGVASSADGMNLAAVGYTAVGGAIYHSGDAGASWSQYSLPDGFSNYLGSVASSADGRKLVAVGYGVYTSTNYGATWQQQFGVPAGKPNNPAYWNTVADSADGTKLVIGGEYPVDAVYTSQDSGVTWVSNNIPVPIPFPWCSVAASTDGSKIAAIPVVTGIGIFTVDSSGLSESITATPRLVDLQDSIQVDVMVHNGTTNTLTNVQVDGSISVTGSSGGGVAFQDFSGPSVVLSLPPGTNATLTYNYVATNYGAVKFSADAVGQGPKGPVYSLPATSAGVVIIPKCDLLVKTAAPNDTNFLGAGEFQQVPANDQILRIAVGTNGAANYVVRVQNGSRVAHTFVLRGQNSPAFPNWNFQVLASGVNIMDALTGTDGWTTPSLEPGDYLDLQVSLSPTANAGASDQQYLQLGAYPSSTIDFVLDSVKLIAQIVPVPVQISLYSLSAGGASGGGYTAASIEAGKSDINAPLVPVTDTSVLANQSLIHSGLVADDVTPLLIQLNADPVSLAQYPQGVQFSIQPTLSGYGKLNGDPIGQRFEVLQNGVWQPFTPSDSITLTTTNNIGYIELLPILSDDIQLGNGATQLNVDFSVVDGSSAQCGDVQFFIRKPPIALVHGYASPGNWGEDFKSVLGFSRPYIPDAPNDNFIVTVKYLQDVVTNGYLNNFLAQKGVPVYENTVARLDVSARALLGQLTTAMEPLQAQWAFTRFDVVAHSQGGVLTRMLCNDSFNDFISQPFRNPDNFNRGRFHRVVTIGSPHNGTRLLHYLLALYNKNPLLIKNIPQLVAFGGVNLSVLQQKFDPWGTQFQEVNDPDSSSAWYPDPAPIFHLVRPTIDYGSSPVLGDATLSYVLLGLTTATGGATVIPRGSDGVVDFDSMGANVPPASVADNVYTVPPGDLISHAAPTWVFGSTAAETDSTIIAQHVVDALDQNPFVSPADITFDVFPLPPILDTVTEQAIDSYATNFNILTVTNLIQVLQQPRIAGASYPYQFSFPTNLPPSGPVAWSVQVYGPSGISSDGVELSVSGTDNSQVTVMVDGAVVGDVILSATYQSTSNAVVVVPPVLVVSKPPAGATLTGIQVVPANIALPPGSAVSPLVVANYSDGSSSLRYVTADALTVTSSQPSVVSVSDPLNWQFSALGTAQVSLTWSGFTATSQLTVFDASGNTAPTLSLANAGNGQLTFSWPGYTPYQLESSTNLTNTNSWRPVGGTPLMVGGQSYVTLSMTNAPQFFRLQLLP